MWDEAFSSEEYIYGKAPNDFLRDNYQVIPKGRVLLLAEGEGRNAVFLAGKGYRVMAMDSSSVGLEKAQKLAEEQGVEIDIHCEDLTTFDLGEQCWDGIVSIYCHLPEELRRDLYRRVQQALKPDGVFFLEGYRPEQLAYKTGGPPLASMMTSKETLAEQLPQLAFSHLLELDREVIEGSYHTGMAAVVQAIATPRQ
ncbi:MAG: SAM-dependent methyltransferase [Granulosicoccaceae bacterium]